MTNSSLLAACGALLVSSSMAMAQVDPIERGVQIVRVNFADGTIEISNTTDETIALDGWRLCSHDFNESRRYTSSSGLNGFSLDPGQSLTVFTNNDKPASFPSGVDASDLGGAVAGPLDQDAFGMQVFYPGDDGTVRFGDSSDIVDHIQWNVDGRDMGTSEQRTGQAVSEGLWTAAGEFIVTQTDSVEIELTSAIGELLHGPANYTATNPVCRADMDMDGSLTIFDFLAFQNKFDGGEVSADIDMDGALTIFDFLAFQNLFDAGCP